MLEKSLQQRAGSHERIEFAKSLEFAQQAADAGMRYAYLQFDGIATPRTRTAK